MNRRIGLEDLRGSARRGAGPFFVPQAVSRRDTSCPFSHRRWNIRHPAATVRRCGGLWGMALLAPADCADVFLEDNVSRQDLP